ncbi:DUF202 domain-containing protein [Actinomadura sp. WMMB 499]|uniref:DUF202 domain-containing protein n=1 Tax=Actinomadura sp. WMMB 499 TaxID=1219491 RepID=UPI00124654AA|nr:DUF202 domain-containing protein [Actinomadura sp. WMMB 499]QFG25361.1 DUF202 domain-containing protein [Actinomadura sp. WMMB 499]
MTAPPLWDRGAQPERTALAWSRTTLALLVVGLLCVRLAPSDLGAGAAAAVVCGAAALQLRRTGRSLRRRGDRLPRGRRIADAESVLLATGLTILLAVAGILLAV